MRREIKITLDYDARSQSKLDPYARMLVLATVSNFKGLINTLEELADFLEDNESNRLETIKDYINTWLEELGEDYAD